MSKCSQIAMLSSAQGVFTIIYNIYDAVTMKY
jgi:hypothetical protein